MYKGWGDMGREEMLLGVHSVWKESCYSTFKGPVLGALQSGWGKAPFSEPTGFSFWKGTSIYDASSFIARQTSVGEGWSAELQAGGLIGLRNPTKGEAGINLQLA